jgi:integrase
MTVMAPLWAAIYRAPTASALPVDVSLWVEGPTGSLKSWLSTPKSRKVRRVDMSQQLARVLQGWLTLREAEAVLAGRPVSAWLFPNAHGGRLNPGRWRRIVWAPLLRRAGLRHRGPHQLRHSFATLLLQQGESPVYVKDQLGHASIKITVDTYGHLLPGANRQAVDRLDNIGPTLDRSAAEAPEAASIRDPAATEVLGPAVTH